MCVCARVCVWCVYHVRQCNQWLELIESSKFDAAVSFKKTVLTLFQCTQLYNGYLGVSGVNWGSSPPSCNLNGYLVLTGEVNTHLFLNGAWIFQCWFHLYVCVRVCLPSLVRHGTVSCGYPRRICLCWLLAPE